MEDTVTNPDRRTFGVSAGTISYIDQGAGDPVVFVHGNPSSSSEFLPAIAGLSATHRCLAMDHIGFGQSDKPPAWDYLPKSHAENAAQLLDSFDLQNVTMVVGDWGGPIGLSWALANPSRMRSVIITNSWLWPVNRSLYYQGFSKFTGGPIGRMLTTRYNFFARQVTKRAWGSAVPLTPEIYAGFTEVHPRADERKGMWVFPREIIGSTAWLAALWEQRRVLDDIDITLLWGMKDIAFRADILDTWQREFEHARAIRLDTVGHFPAREAPEQLISAIQDQSTRKA